VAVGITQTANPAGVGTSGNVATYSGVSVGTASADRVIAVLIGIEEAVTISGVTIGGVAMQLASQSYFTEMGAGIFWAPFPTGTTADVAVTLSGPADSSQNHIAVYALTDAAFPPQTVGSDSSSDMDTTDPLTTGSVTIPTNGGFIAIAAGARAPDAKTWANATGDIDASVGEHRFTTATRTTAGTVTITCTGGFNGEDGVLAFMIVSSQQMPTVVMSPLMPT